MFELGDLDLNDSPEPKPQVEPYIPAIGGAPSFGVAEGHFVPGYSGVGYTFTAAPSEDE